MRGYRWQTSKWKKCSIIPVIKEIQIKINMGHHYIPTRTAKIETHDNTKRWQRCTENQSSYTGDGNTKLYSHSEIQLGNF